MPQNIVTMKDGSITYPMDYRLFNIGENLGVRDTPKGPLKFYKIRNRNKVPFISRYGDAANSDYASALTVGGGWLGVSNINDWMELNKNVLGIFVVQFNTDRDIEVRIFQPEATQIGGIKKDPDVQFVTGDYDEGEAPFILQAFGEDNIPMFSFQNPSEYVPTWFEVAMSGYRYWLDPIQVVKTSDRDLIMPKGEAMYFKQQAAEEVESMFDITEKMMRDSGMRYSIVDLTVIPGGGVL